MTIAPLTSFSQVPVQGAKSGVAAQTAAQIAPQAAAATTTVADPQPLALPELLQTVLNAARQSAAARQDGLSVLMANALRAAASAQLPTDVKAAIDQLLALHLPTDQAPDAAAVKQALKTSGLFTEANMSSGAARIPVDVKTALVQLNNAAESWLARLAVSPDSKQEATLRKPAGTPPAEQRTGDTPARTTAPLAKTQSPAVSTPSPGTAAPQRPAPTQSPQASSPEISPVEIMAAKTDPVAGAVRNPAPVPEEALQTSAAKSAATPPQNASDGAKQTVPFKTAAAPQQSASQAESETVPDRFKPVLRLLTQAVAVLRSEPQPVKTQTAVASQTAAQANPVAKPAPVVSPATQPTSETGAAPSPLATVKTAQMLVQQAVERWPAAAPSQPAARPALPVSPALDAMTTVIAAQTFATAPEAPQSDAPLPPAIKAVLALLGNVVQPLLDAAPDADAGRAAPAAQRDLPSRDTAKLGSTEQPSKRPAPAQTAASAPPAQAEVPISSSPPPLPQQTGAAPNEVRALLGLLGKVVEIWHEAPSQQGGDAASGRPAQTNTTQPASAQPSVPPPTPGAPGKAQGVATPSLPEHADAALIAKTLAAGSDAALARQTLLQIASLPDTANPVRNSEPRWMFDIPVMTAQGPAVAQIVIERDGRNGSAEAQKPVWRMQFAIDIEPLGPVRANIALCGERAWVTIAADRPESLTRLQNQVSWLSDALQSETLEADIAFQTGAGTQVAARAKPLVDRAS